MKIEKLIADLTELQKKHPEINVSLFDWRKNLGDDIGDGSSVGVHSDFEIEVYKLDADEAAYYKERHEKDFIPWVSIAFENDDYNDDGVNVF